MSAVDEAFKKVRASGKKAFVPFVTAGDPDLDFTSAMLLELSARGATVCEVGIPYSDPIADGPVIQASYTRALEKGIRLEEVFAMLAKTTRQMTAPVVTMVSYAIVMRRGLEKYVKDAKAAGVSGAIVPDLLVEEAEQFSKICRREDFSLIQLVTPTTPRPRAVQIAKASSGFLYYVSVTGITGERKELPPELLENVRWLKSQTDLPICIGFGISRPEHVKQLGSVADGVIVGSALVRQIENIAGQDRSSVLRSLGKYAEEMIAALPQDS